jgi:hypothetical protein
LSTKTLVTVTNLHCNACRIENERGSMSWLMEPEIVSNTFIPGSSTEFTFRCTNSKCNNSVQVVVSMEPRNYPLTPDVPLAIVPNEKPDTGLFHGVLEEDWTRAQARLQMSRQNNPGYSDTALLMRLLTETR